MEALPLIRIAGGAFERGQQYGRAAADQIALVLDVYRNEFARKDLSWAEASTLGEEFGVLMRDYDAELMTEIEGIAEGARQSVSAIVILNARTELVYWKGARDGAAARNGPEFAPDECTSGVAMPEITADGHLLHAQNWDWQPDCAAASLVLHIEHEDERPDILTCVEAGQLARHGMNRLGLGLTANGLHSGHDYGRFGVPNPFIRRRMLASPTLARALYELMNSPRAFSHNVTVSDAAGEAFDIETTPDECFWLEPDEGVLSHANHFKCPVARLRVADANIARCPETIYRERRLRAALKRASGQITVDTFKAALADRYGAPDSICRSPAPRPGGMVSASLYSLIMDVTARRMWVAPTPFEGAEYAEYGFDAGPAGGCR
ncbi:MAG TPA: C45 family peptidase [Woeseiaceae bacterium]|nr:C45 family peptidase [Woeseiaceae bacterium]